MRTSRFASSPAFFVVLPIIAIIAAVATWPNMLRRASSSDYLPHGFCFMWNPQLLALHITSDLVIFISYMTISATLGVMWWRYRRDIPLAWIVVAFGLFIVTCGLTHLMDVVVIWHPLYWLAGDIKLLTAIASAVTAGALPVFVPRIGTLLSEANVSKLNEQRFLAASNNSNESFYILESVRDTSGEICEFRFVFANSNGASLLSTTSQQLVGVLLCEAYPVNRTGGFFEKYRGVVETGEEIEEEFPIHADRINATWLRYHVVKLGDGVAISTSNISRRKQAELKLIENLAFTRSLITSSPFAVISMDLAGLITEVNPAAERMLLYSRDELVGKTTPILFHDRYELEKRAGELSEELDDLVETDAAVLMAKPRRGLTDEAEWTYVRKGGSRLTVLLTVTPLTDNRPEFESATTGYLCVAYDITERKRLEEYLSHVANHDALTGLPTRTLLHDRLQTALRRAERTGKKLALLMIDLDNFKQVNDSMGHSAGDDLLIGVAKRLQETVRKSDTVARLGGDEFVVLLDDLNSRAEAESITQKIARVLCLPISINSETHTTSASIGLCMYPEGGNEAGMLLKNADAAMYHAKSKGRKNYQVFSAD